MSEESKINQEIPNADQEIPKLPGNTFKVGEFEFSLPQVSKDGRILGGSMIELIMIASIAAGNDNIRKVFQAAKVEIKDVSGKRFFP